MRATRNNKTNSLGDVIWFLSGEGRLQGTATTLYVHDINNHIIAETNTAGQTLREYIWLNDLPVAVVDNVNTASPALYYVHSDHLGRPARMTAQNQSWAWDVIYDPFGNVSYSWSNPEVMNIRFPGQWFQLETGLAYNWHRHYDATLGRYVQPDPLGLKALMSDGPSAYGYVGGNPLAYDDPFGLYGTKSCAFYLQSCQQYGGDYECNTGLTACTFFNNFKGKWGSCVRQCLQERSKQRRPTCPENISDHYDCFTGCAMNSENPYSANGPDLPDDNINLP